MLIRDVMQPEVATLRVDDTLDLASDIMELGRIRHLAELSAGDGERVVSQRDLYRAAVSSLLELRSSAQRDWLAKIPVRSVMATAVQTVAPTDSVHEAVERMLEHRIGCLPVVEHGKERIGESLRIIVTSVLQTVAGKMIFGNPLDGGHSTQESSHRNQRVDSGCGARRKASLTS